MNKNFQESYANLYDTFYEDKDYEGECDFVEAIFRKHLPNNPRSILDVGCGTGGHTIPLARRGYEVTGVDRSGEMLSIAKEKAKRAGTPILFYRQDIREIDTCRKYDAAICMFAVFDYLLTPDDVRKALVSVREQLYPSSLFTFDFWNGLAVLKIRPENRMKTIKYGEQGEIIRFVTPKLDPIHQTCENTYRCLIKIGDRVLKDFGEVHTMRFFYPDEITHYLEENGFKLLDLFPFMEIGKEFDENTWNLTAVAKVK